MNRARWLEYSLSSSVMIVVIAMLVGIYDVASLLLLFAANASMILFGWLMEVQNAKRERVDWTAYWFGVFAGAVPWVASVGILDELGAKGFREPAFVDLGAPAALAHEELRPPLARRQLPTAGSGMNSRSS